MSNYHIITPEQLANLIAVTPPDDPWILDTETDGLEVIGPKSKHRAHWVGLMPTGRTAALCLTAGDFAAVQHLLDDRLIVGHNIRFDLHALNWFPSRIQCTMADKYFCNTTGKKSLDHCARLMGRAKITTPDELKKGLILSMDQDRLCTYLADDVLATDAIYRGAGRGCPDGPLELAVACMEDRGVRLLRSPLAELGITLGKEIETSRTRLQVLGFSGNPGSPKQVLEYFRGQGRELKTTDKMMMEKLSAEGDAFADALLKWRKNSKLWSAFYKPLSMSPCLIHARVNTTRTATGRFSYQDPNLQQIPKRSKLGKRFRSCFTGEGYHVSGADFSQVELRVAAALAQEPTLLQAFAQGRDPHTEVAAQMLGKKLDKVTPEERFGAKAVNFGIMNGMGAKRLSHELKSSLPEARRFLDSYRRSMPKLTDWMEAIWAETEDTLVARTGVGRTRIFRPDDSTRPAVSVIVQGTAAELMRHALVKVNQAGLEPILVVHDEIVCNTLDRGQEVATIMTQAANEAFGDPSVDFKADPGQGGTWNDI